MSTSAYFRDIPVGAIFLDDGRYNVWRKLSNERAVSSLSALPNNIVLMTKAGASDIGLRSYLGPTSVVYYPLDAEKIMKVRADALARVTQIVQDLGFTATTPEETTTAT